MCEARKMWIHESITSADGNEAATRDIVLSLRQVLSTIARILSRLAGDSVSPRTRSCRNCRLCSRTAPASRGANGKLSCSLKPVSVCSGLKRHGDLVHICTSR